MQCCDLPYQPHTAPANGQHVHCRRRGRRNDRDALKSGGPPEDFRCILQRLRRPGTQEREHCLRTCQPRPEPARSQSAAVALAANAVPPAEPFPPLRWQIQRGADQPGAALTDRAVPGPCPRRSGRSHTRGSQGPPNPATPQRSNSALTSQRAQSTGMPIPRIAAPVSVGERSQRTGSAVGNCAGTASSRGAGSGSSNRNGSGAASIKECPSAEMQSTRPVPVAVCRRGRPRASALAQSPARRGSGVARTSRRARRQVPHRGRIAPAVVRQ